MNISLLAAMAAIGAICMSTTFLVLLASSQIKLSFEIANHLTNYINDYNYINSKDKSAKVLRKGEIRDQFGSVSALNNKDDNSSIDNANKNSKVKIKFDTDSKKTGWLNYQIKRNGGDKDIMLAIQVVLQKNQKAFLRSWKVQ